MQFHFMVCAMLTFFGAVQADDNHPWMALILGFAAGMNCLAAVRAKREEKA